MIGLWVLAGLVPAAFEPLGAGLPTDLSLGACISVDERALRRRITLELGVTMAATSTLAAGNGPRVEIKIDCPSPGIVSIHLRDPITRKALERELDAAELARGGDARLLALAVAELVAASWSELAAIPEPKVAAIGAPVESEWRREALKSVRQREPAPRLELAASGGVLGFPLGGTAGGAYPLAGVRARPCFFDWLGVSLELSAFTGRREAGLGSVSVLGASGAAAVSAEWLSRPLALRSGLGARGGAAALSGKTSEAAEGQTVLGPFFGPFLTTSAGHPLFDAVFLEVSVEVGYAMTGVAGLVQGQRVVEVGGLWVAGALAVGVQMW